MLLKFLAAKPAEEERSQDEQVAQISQAVEERPTDEFDIHAGMRVDVLTLQNRLTFIGKVDSYRGGALVIRDARDYDLPPVLYNKEIRLRFARDKNSLVLHGRICGSSSQIWKIDRLESKFTKEQRVYFRQRLSTNPPATCYRRSAPGSPGTKPARCEILDISAGGVLIRCREKYEVGDHLMVNGISITDKEESFNFVCQVRRVGEVVETYISYGCQFETLSSREQDRLLRAIFTVQREEIRRQREKGEEI